jgi:hypothetical protein
MLKRAQSNGHVTPSCSAPPGFGLPAHYQKMKNHGTPSRSAALVHAVKVHGGPSFPTWARAIQHQDFTRFAYTGEAFPKTELYLELEDAMWRLAEQIAVAIKNSPPWNSEWIEAELTDDVFDDGFRPQGLADPPPTLE